MPSESVEGRALHYELAGEGTPVVLLHGFPLSSESFSPQLERPPRGARLIIPDHRGFGRSSPGGPVLEMDAIASDVLALMDALGVEKAVVGGVSMGGYASLAFARLAPQRLLGLLLVDTHHLADDEAGRARREATAKAVEAGGISALADEMLPKLLSPRAGEPLRAEVRRLIRAQAPGAVAAASRGMARRPDSGLTLSQVSQPSLIVVGAEDVLTPPPRAEAMVGLLPTGQLEVLAGAGHLANLEQPDAFNRAVERWLAERFEKGGAERR